MQLRLMAASKSEYLKRKYLSPDTRGSVPGMKKKLRKIIKKHSANVIIHHDDDVDWKTIVPEPQASLVNQTLFSAHS